MKLKRVFSLLIVSALLAYLVVIVIVLGELPAIHEQYMHDTHLTRSDKSMPVYTDGKHGAAKGIHDNTPIHKVSTLWT